MLKTYPVPDSMLNEMLRKLKRNLRYRVECLPVDTFCFSPHSLRIAMHTD